jgi:hypothetical protein
MGSLRRFSQSRRVCGLPAVEGIHFVRSSIRPVVCPIRKSEDAALFAGNISFAAKMRGEVVSDREPLAGFMKGATEAAEIGAWQRCCRKVAEGIPPYCGVVPNPWPYHRDQIGIRFATGRCGERKQRQSAPTVHILAAFCVTFRIHPAGFPEGKPQ